MITMTGRRFRRRIVSRVMTSATVLAATLAVIPLFMIFAYLLLKGASSVDLNFFLQNPAPAGTSGGGVAPAIVGTGIVVGIAALIGLPIGVGAGVFLAEFGTSRLSFIVRFVSDVLNGTPSILVGVVVWTWMVRPMGHFSALAGSVSLAILMIPMVTRTTEEMVNLVPGSLREAALALGYTRWRTSLKIVLRTALPGVVTGALVAVARITGETAPLLFTAFGNLNFRTDPLEPMQTLSLQVFTYATGPFPEWHRLAWGAALVLVTLVLVFSLGARYVTRRRF
jgi:phosphate transport system permease protein